MLQTRPRTSITPLAIIMVVLVSGCASEIALPIDPVRSITFRTVGRIPVIEARLNGKPATFIIDTGASVSILNTSEAAFYGFEVFTLQSDAVDVTGFSGVSSIHNAGRCTIEIGSLRITHLRFRSRDMHDFARTLYPSGETRIAGILGSDMLMHYKMKIDFVDQKVIF